MEKMRVLALAGLYFAEILYYSAEHQFSEKSPYHDSKEMTLKFAMKSLRDGSKWKISRLDLDVYLVAKLIGL